jgi:hypothetical protein
MVASKFKKTAAVGVGLLAVLGVSLAGTQSATADPYRGIVAVGSDTIQDVWNGLSNGTTPAIPNVASYNAFGTADIQTRDGGVIFTRPAGSGDGIRALSASANTANHNYSDAVHGSVNLSGQVDFARSSSGPSVAGSALTFIPFARDAVSVAYVAPLSTSPTPNFTQLQLKSIFECTTSADGVITNAGGGADPVWHVGATATTLHAKLPQSSSGTRKFFLQAAGITAPGACVKSTSVFPTPVGADAMHENNALELTTNGDIAPFSAAQWIAQKKGHASTFTGTNQAQIKIATVGGVVAVSGSGASSVPGALYGSASTVPSGAVGVFGRDVYNVIPTTAVGTSLEATLKGTATGQLGNAAAQTIIADYGFLNLTYLGSNYKTGAFTNP